MVCGVCKWCVYDPFLGDLFDFLICIYLFIFGCVVFFFVVGTFLQLQRVGAIPCCSVRASH